jgi:hypothetical protein
MVWFDWYSPEPVSHMCVVCYWLFRFELLNKLFAISDVVAFVALVACCLLRVPIALVDLDMYIGLPCGCPFPCCLVRCWVSETVAIEL